MEKLKAIFKKIVNKETILYVVFGVLTTLVNFVAFKLFTMVFDKLISSQLGVHISNVLAWIFAVAFAYVTNKLFVFENIVSFDLFESYAPQFFPRPVSLYDPLQ